MPDPSLSRRNFCRCAGGVLGLSAAASLFTPSHAHAAAAGTPKTTLTPDEALQRMEQGNADFLADKPKPVVQDHRRRIEIAKGQAPFAVLVGCSDSRVSPELLFGTGLGELFIVRNAGNTVDTVSVLGSIEYGVAVLGAPLVVVLGHERCGAVDAALKVVEKNEAYPGSIGYMIEPILPAALKAKSAGGDPDALLTAAIKENVRRNVARLRSAEALLTEPQKAGKLRVVGAYYDLDEGRVDFFDK